jgi:cytidine deaminase
MKPPPADTIGALRALAAAAAGRSRAPYSGRPEAAVLLLSDGTWIPGVRVESASFSLLLPAAVNAFSTAVAAARRDVVALALSRPARAEERLYLEATPAGPFAAAAADVFVPAGTVAPLPEVRRLLFPFLEAALPPTAVAGIALARDVARRAFIPESAFPVGCVFVTEEGRLLPGVNVEHPDWTRTLCAERTALGTAASYGLAGLCTLYLSCPLEPAGTPCGACRQLLAELAPETTVWMDRGEAPPERATPAALLPGSFSGQRLPRRG